MNNNIHTGDVLAVSGRGWLSWAIQLGTYSIPGFGVSHVAIVGEWLPRYKDYLVYESTTFGRPACAITGHKTSGFQAHTLRHWLQINETAGNKVWVGRLTCELYGHEEQRLIRSLRQLVGTPYDTLGAFHAGGRLFSWLESLIHANDLSSVFCSEVLAWSLATLGRFRTRKFGKWNPNSFCRALWKNCAILKWSRVV